MALITDDVLPVTTLTDDQLGLSVWCNPAVWCDLAFWCGGTSGGLTKDICVITSVTDDIGI